VKGAISQSKYSNRPELEERGLRILVESNASDTLYTFAAQLFGPLLIGRPRRKVKPQDREKDGRGRKVSEVMSYCAGRSVDASLERQQRRNELVSYGHTIDSESMELKYDTCAQKSPLANSSNRALEDPPVTRSSSSIITRPMTDPFDSSSSSRVPISPSSVHNPTYLTFQTSSSTFTQTRSPTSRSKPNRLEPPSFPSHHAPALAFARTVRRTGVLSSSPCPRRSTTCSTLQFGRASSTSSTSRPFILLLHRLALSPCNIFRILPVTPPQSLCRYFSLFPPYFTPSLPPSQRSTSTSPAMGRSAQGSKT
jgi:hypothetical protein